MRQLVMFVAAVGTAAAAPGSERNVVRIDSGPLVGSDQGGVVAFKGIPFAAPPVGVLRWQPPRPAPRWNGVREATAYGPDCMQKPYPSDAAPLGTEPSEDCLYLNVWRPSGNARKLPVLVWIYGGGFVNGGASPPTYSGAALARQGLLIVSFNYRLGRFGTFAHPALVRSEGHGAAVNFAYMDQIAALNWVRRNVTAFGGDPDNVTIAGESAGGVSVHAMLTSPLTKGLFSKAVVMSGGPMAIPDRSTLTVEAAGLAFARRKGIQDDDVDAADRLRNLSAQDVVDGLDLAQLRAPVTGQRTFSGPVPDGRVAVDVMAAYRAGRFAQVPTVVGFTSDDIGGADGVMVTGARSVASLISGHGVPTYAYRFSYVATSARTPTTRGARHATEIPFFFDTAQAKYGAATSALDQQAAAMTSRYLVNFVKSGNPNGPGQGMWHPYRSAAPRLLDIGSDATAVMIPYPSGGGALQPQRPGPDSDAATGREP